MNDHEIYKERQKRILLDEYKKLQKNIEDHKNDPDICSQVLCAMEWRLYRIASKLLFEHETAVKNGQKVSADSDVIGLLVIMKDD